MTERLKKVTVLSPDGKTLAVAGTNSVCGNGSQFVSFLNKLQLQLLSYPSLAPVAPAVNTDKEIYDATFSKNTVPAPRFSLFAR